MDFEELLKKIIPKLKQLSIKYNGRHSFFDEEDLFSEMTVQLWKNWENGDIKNRTESYIVQMCYFHLRNYLRCVKQNSNIVSIDEPINEDGMTLTEIVSDNSLPIDNFLEEKMFLEKIKNNRLLKIEKIIFKLLYDGFTVREIGKKLDISHTMVVKHKKNLIKKVSKKCNFLLV